MITVDSLALQNGDRVVLKDYSLSVQKGDIVAIMGSNGVGKTTLLNAMIGLKKPIQGSIQSSGQIGYVPQLFDMPFSYSAGDVVLMGRARYLGLTGSPKPQDFELAHHYMKMMQVDALASSAFNELSGGQKQLIMIAQALTSQCDLLVLDEPCSALDYHNQAIVLDKLGQLNQTLGLTIIYTTHMPQHALEMSTQALLMYDVSRYLYGPTFEALTAEHLTSLYGIEVAQAIFQSDQSTTLAPRFRSLL